MPDLRSGTVPLVLFFFTLAAMTGFILELRYLEIPENQPGPGPGDHGSGNGTGEGGPLVEAGGGGGEAGGTDASLKGTSPAAGGGVGVGKRNETSPPERDIRQTLVPISSGAGGTGRGEGADPESGKRAAGGGQGGAGSRAPEAGGGGGDGETGGTTIQIPQWAAWLLAALVGILVAAGMVRFAISYLGAAKKARLKAAEKALAKEAKVRQKEELLEELKEILGKEIVAVEGAGDIRAAIVLSYTRLISALASRGILRQLSATPREFLALWGGLLGAPSAAMGGLTRLFEEAVYSVHRMGEEHRESARRNLVLGLEEVRAWKGTAGAA